MDQWRRIPSPGDPPEMPAFAPGIYGRGDGSRQAFNAPVLPAPPPPDGDEAKAVRRLAALIADRPPGRDATPIAVWLALAFLATAAAVWKRT